MAFGHKPLKSLVLWWVSRSACAAQPGVAGVQVVAASNGESDPVPVAFVRPAAGTALDEAALRARCREQLARFKVPARIVAVDAFPTVDGPNGPKVQRVRLREMAQTLLREEERGRRRDAGADCTSTRSPSR